MLRSMVYHTRFGIPVPYLYGIGQLAKQSTSIANTMSIPYLTTFADALHVSPTLTTLCISCYSSHARAGQTHQLGGVRTLRLVSKSVGQAAWKAACKFTLGVGEAGWPETHTQDMVRVTQLLKSITLKVLELSLGACHREVNFVSPEDEVFQREGGLFLIQMKSHVCYQTQ